MQGLVHLYCGDGKGKSTAAVGLSVRASGAGLPVVFAQFFKAGSLYPLHGTETPKQCHPALWSDPFYIIQHRSDLASGP